LIILLIIEYIYIYIYSLPALFIFFQFFWYKKIEEKNSIFLANSIRLILENFPIFFSG
jgi:hypothetical protein